MRLTAALVDPKTGLAKLQSGKEFIGWIALLTISKRYAISIAVMTLVA